MACCILQRSGPVHGKRCVVAHHQRRQRRLEPNDNRPQRLRSETAGYQSTYGMKEQEPAARVCSWRTVQHRA